MVKSNYYIVAKNTPMGTHTTYGVLKNDSIILYQGKNAIDANFVYRKENKVASKFSDEHDTMIYKSINGLKPKSDNHGFVIHKV